MTSLLSVYLLLLLLQLLRLPHELEATSRRNLTVGIALVAVRPRNPEARAAARPSARTGDPPPELPPAGVHIYDSLHQAPARLLSRHPSAQTRSSFKNSRCSYDAYICGRRCENVLLAMRAYCRSRKDGLTWVRCEKARTFRRCFAKVCYRGRASQRLKLPAGFYDDGSVIIVRYRRPPPLYERKARQNRQSSTQSVLFK